MIDDVYTYHIMDNLGAMLDIINVYYYVCAWTRVKQIYHWFIDFFFLIVCILNKQ